MRISVKSILQIALELVFLVLPVRAGRLAPQSDKPRPQFQEYPVKHIYRGRPAPPVMNEDQRMFRTRIRRGARSSVEFAGRYTVPRWGCGTECNDFVIVDSITGRVYDGFGVHGLPWTWLDEHGGDDALPRMEFYPNSRLMRINACPNEKNCGLYDYVMVDGKGLKLVRKELLPNEFQ